MNKTNLLIIPGLVCIAVLLLFSTDLTYANLDLFEKKCSKCHMLYKPDNYSNEEWKRNVQRMAPKARLSPEQVKSIIRLNTK